MPNPFAAVREEQIRQDERRRSEHPLVAFARLIFLEIPAFVIVTIIGLIALFAG